MDLYTIFWMVMAIAGYVLVTNIINHMYSLHRNYRIVKLTIYGGVIKYRIERYRYNYPYGYEWVPGLVYDSLEEAQEGLKKIGATTKEEVIR